MVTIATSTPKHSTFAALPSKVFYPVNVKASVVDDNPAITRVGATLNWNDGTAPVVFTPASSLAIDTTRNLAVGTYFITLSAYNFAAPTPGQAAYYFSVVVQPEHIAPAPIEYLFGPILPLDNGFPSNTQWNFDVGSNAQVLMSSVKMLLITNKGERIMQPNYGTTIRRAVFDPNVENVRSIIQQEIETALTQYEPRVTLLELNVQKTGQSDISVDANFITNASQAFSLSLPFSQ